ncbi:hypothetical protein Hdeb2414_s0006g00211631 [Helianthus debilis subsp. tardiflorus]
MSCYTDYSNIQGYEYDGNFIKVIYVYILHYVLYYKLLLLCLMCRSVYLFYV